MASLDLWLMTKSRLSKPCNGWELDRRRVRKRFEERFGVGRMAADYVSHYESVVDRGSKTADKCCLRS
jgi:hypothetical protein